MAVIKFGYYQVRQRRSLQMGLKMETSFFSKCILCILLQYSVNRHRQIFRIYGSLSLTLMLRLSIIGSKWVTLGDQIKIKSIKSEIKSITIRLLQLTCKSKINKYCTSNSTVPLSLNYSPVSSWRHCVYPLGVSLHMTITWQSHDMHSTI